jgi:hypothetical protein
MTDRDSVSILRAEPIPPYHCRIGETFTAVILVQSAPNREMICPHDPAVKTPDEHSNISIGHDSNKYASSALNPGICPLPIGHRMLVLHPWSVCPKDSLRALRNVSDSHFIVTRKGRARA